MNQVPELLSIERALDELSRAARGLRYRLGNTLDVCGLNEDLSRLRADSALLARSVRRLAADPPNVRAPIPDEDYDQSLWRHDDEGLGGFASTLGRPSSQAG